MKTAKILTQQKNFKKTDVLLNKTFNIGCLNSSDLILDNLLPGLKAFINYNRSEVMKNLLLYLEQSVFVGYKDMVIYLYQECLTPDHCLELLKHEKVEVLEYLLEHTTFQMTSLRQYHLFYYLSLYKDQYFVVKLIKNKKFNPQHWD